MRLKIHDAVALDGRGPALHGAPWGQAGLLLGGAGPWASAAGCGLQAQGRAGESARGHSSLGVAHPRGHAISRRDRLANTEILGAQRGLGGANIGLQAIGERDL